MPESGEAGGGGPSATPSSPSRANEVSDFSGDVRLVEVRLISSLSPSSSGFILSGFRSTRLGHDPELETAGLKAGGTHISG
jgi:hypothetical protein